MFTLDDIKKLLTQKIKQHYYYPIEVRSSVDEENTLCIYIYCVEKSIENELEEYIYKLQEDLDPGYDFLFLPMVKNLEVTKKYYPDMFKLLCVGQQAIDPFEGTFVNKHSIFEVRMPYRSAPVASLTSDFSRGCKSDNNEVFKLSGCHLSNWHSHQNNSVEVIQTNILKCA